MNRRAVLKTLSAAVAACAAPAAALGSEVEQSRIIELFRRHQKLVDAAENHPMTKEEIESPDCDTVMDRLFYDEIYRIEDEMLTTPCKTPADFAAKVIVATSRGGLIPDWDEGVLFIEARALIG